jgi:hypothetical protein
VGRVLRQDPDLGDNLTAIVRGLIARRAPGGGERSPPR